MPFWCDWEERHPNKKSIEEFPAFLIGCPLRRWFLPMKNWEDRLAIFPASLWQMTKEGKFLQCPCLLSKMAVIRQKYDYCKRSIPITSWKVCWSQFCGISRDSGWMVSPTLRPTQQLPALHWNLCKINQSKWFINSLPLRSRSRCNYLWLVCCRLNSKAEKVAGHTGPQPWIQQIFVNYNFIKTLENHTYQVLDNAEQ